MFITQTTFPNLGQNQNSKLKLPKMFKGESVCPHSLEQLVNLRNYEWSKLGNDPPYLRPNVIVGTKYRDQFGKDHGSTPFGTETGLLGESHSVLELYSNWSRLVTT